jgi:hypothetical protein
MVECPVWNIWLNEVPLGLGVYCQYPVVIRLSHRLITVSEHCEVEYTNASRRIGHHASYECETRDITLSLRVGACHASSHGRKSYPATVEGAP